MMLLFHWRLLVAAADCPHQKQSVACQHPLCDVTVTPPPSAPNTRWLSAELHMFWFSFSVHLSNARLLTGILLNARWQRGRGQQRQLLHCLWEDYFFSKRLCCNLLRRQCSVWPEPSDGINCVSKPSSSVLQAQPDQADSREDFSCQRSTNARQPSPTETFCFHCWHRSAAVPTKRVPEGLHWDCGRSVSEELMHGVMPETDSSCCPAPVSVAAASNRSWWSCCAERWRPSATSLQSSRRTEQSRFTELRDVMMNI